jgi:UDP-glucose 4-epimerase
VRKKIDAVMHFASLIQVGESVINPAKYYENNLGNIIVLLNSMANHGVESFFFL